MILSPTGLSSVPPFANMPMSAAWPLKWSETFPLADMFLWYVPVVIVIGLPMEAASCGDELERHRLDGLAREGWRRER